MVLRPFLFLACGSALAIAATTSSPTFHKNVEPILQNRCQECHRSGRSGAHVVHDLQRRAPVGQSHPRSRAHPQDAAMAGRSALRQIQQRPVAFPRTTSIRWWPGPIAARARAIPPTRPSPSQFVDGWGIHQPDVVFEMPNEFAVPASGTIDYQYIVIPSGFTEDKWVQEVEARPGNRQVVHHIIAFIRPPGSKWLKDAQPGIPFVLPKTPRTGKSGSKKRRDDGERAARTAGGLRSRVAARASYAPARPSWSRPAPISSSRCTTPPTAKPATDRSRIGLVFAKEPPTERVFTIVRHERQIRDSAPATRIRKSNRRSPCRSPPSWST